MELTAALSAHTRPQVHRTRRAVANSKERLPSRNPSQKVDARDARGVQPSTPKEASRVKLEADSDVLIHVNLFLSNPLIMLAVVWMMVKLT